MQKDDVLLRMEGICKSFPGVKALDDAQLTVRPGTVHALMGENGAGKSTLMKCLFGIYSKDAGTIWFDGKEVNFKSSRDALDNGVAMVHQELNQALKRSVMDNIWLGRYPRIKLGGAKMPFVSDKAEYDMTMEVFKDLNFEKFGININPRTIMSTMPVSRRQMVEIAKAVSFNSKIIVLDEPTSSLTEAEVEVLFSIINMLKARGVGIVYISHKMKEIWRIADDVTVMRDGRWITTRHKTEYGTDDDSFRAEVIRNMCGRELSAAYPPKDNIVHDDPMIVVEGLAAKYNQLRDASFTLHKGEILGVAGLDGSGRTELLETLFGYRTRQSGTIKKFNFGFRAAQGGTPEDYSMEVHDINGTQVGEEISNLSPNSAIKQGFALVTEERRATGIFGILDIRANTVIANLKNYKLGKFPLLSDAKMARDTDRMIEAMHIKTPSQRQQIKNLSGGNQQKVIFGRWMLTNPDVLLLDDPTRGIDVGAKYEIYELIQSLAKQGKSIIMVSSEMPELLGTCNRILVMSAGQIAGEYVPTGDGKVDQEKILELAAKNL